MNGRSDTRDETSDLRSRAERSLSLRYHKDVDIKDLSQAEVAQIVHELQVHQVELEMQNEELRRAQSELEVARDKYVELYDYAPVGYFTLNKQSIIINVNLTGCGLLGFDRSFLLGRPLSRFVQSDDVTAYHMYISSIIETGKSTCELLLQRQDGSTFDAHLETVAENEDNNARVTYRMIVTDITERKLKEQSLLESNTRFRNLFETVHDGVGVFKPIDVDMNFVLFALNTAFAEIWHVKRDNAIGRKVHDLLGNDYGWRLSEIFTKAWQTESPESCRIERRLNDTSHQWIDCNIYKLPSDEVVVISRDITHHIKLEQDALYQTEERFRAVFESVTLCIFIEDTDLKYTHVNRSAMNLLGISPPQIIGHSAEEVFGEEIGKQIAEKHARVLTGESVEYEQTRIVQGIPLTFSEIAVPLKNSGSEIIGVCCICRNVVEQKKVSPEPGGAAELYASAAMKETMKLAHAAASADGIVFLQGESGCGKDFLARWVHEHSARASGPFFAINCATLPEHLAESELFGHERGAFTGAAVKKKGLLELAEGGTILLNEIGELPLNLQSKLLMFLDTNSFMRVGGQKHVKVEARLMAATHRDLNEELSLGRFLKPLFYRISVFPIHVPSLRERISDIPILVNEILSALARDMQLDAVPFMGPEHYAALSNYSWPGNVRELRNVIERSLILWRGGRFNLTLPEHTMHEHDWSYTVKHVEGKRLREVTAEIINSMCAEMLRRCKGNKTEAARRLDISRDALYRYLRKFDVEP